MLPVTTKSGIYNGYKVIGTQTLGLRGLVLWLKFNEGSGSIAKDSSFYNNHGTIYGAVWTDGKFGKALSYDGVDDYMEVADSSSLHIADRLTVAMWVKVESFSSFQHFISKFEWVAGKRLGFKIWQDSEKKVVFAYGDGSTSSAITSTQTIEEGQWYHIAAVLGDYEEIYINGSLDKQESRGPLDFSTQPLIIGANENASGNFFNGIIDEVRIYNRALSENEIKMLYYNRIGAVPSKTI